MAVQKVLIVDDEPHAIHALGAILTKSGYAVYSAGNGQEALAKVGNLMPDLALLDIRMPVMGGLDCLIQLKVMARETEVLMATAVNDLEVAVQCMQAGAFGYITKPIDHKVLLLNMERALERRTLNRELKQYQLHLEDLVEHRTRENLALLKKLKGSFISSMEIMLGILEYYDPFFGGHSRRVGYLVGQVARELGMSAQESTTAQMAGLLHDVGIVALPKRLRDTPFGKLSQEEIDLVKQQTVFAEELLNPSEELCKLRPIVRSHHERLDGSGFPDGLHGNEIPAASKIIAVANAYDEIVYRRRFTVQKFNTPREVGDFAFQHLKMRAGTHFQPQYVDALEIAVKKNLINAKSVKRLDISDLRKGMMLADDIYDNDGLLVLAKGLALSPLQIKRLSAYCNMQVIGQSFLVIQD